MAQRAWSGMRMCICIAVDITCMCCAAIAKRLSIYEVSAGAIKCEKKALHSRRYYQAGATVLS